jgi:hypothetical protein
MSAGTERITEADAVEPVVDAVKVAEAIARARELGVIK